MLLDYLLARRSDCGLVYSRRFVLECRSHQLVGGVAPKWASSEALLVWSAAQWAGQPRPLSQQVRTLFQDRSQLWAAVTAGSDCVTAFQSAKPAAAPSLVPSISVAALAGCIVLVGPGLLGSKLLLRTNALFLNVLEAALLVAGAPVCHTLDVWCHAADSPHLQGVY